MLLSFGREQVTAQWIKNYEMQYTSVAVQHQAEPYNLLIHFEGPV